MSTTTSENAARLRGVANGLRAAANALVGASEDQTADALRGVAARADDRPARDEPELAPLALDARRDEGELLELPVRDRQLPDLLWDDVRRRVDLVDVDERRFSHYRHRLGDRLRA